MFEDILNGVTWSDSSIQLNDGDTVSSSSLTVSTSSPFKKAVQVKGESQYGNFNYLTLDIIVCGNELLVPMSLSSSTNQLVFDLNESHAVPKSTYTQWFVLSNSDHADCEEIVYELMQGPSCDENLDFENA